MARKVDIGVLEEKCSWLLHPRFFPSKVGGKPAWLDLKNYPDSKELICKKCSDPLVYLCQVRTFINVVFISPRCKLRPKNNLIFQIYAPYETSDDCFHRTIFIFICRNGTCCRANATDNFLVLRCQLPRKNDFFLFNPYEEKEDEVKSEKYFFIKYFILC